MSHASAPSLAAARGDGAVLAFGAGVLVASEFVVVGMAPSLARSFDLSIQQSAWLITIFAVGSALLGPLVVIATRRLRPDLAMACALLPFAASMLLAWHPQWWQICLLRFIQGAALPLFIALAGDVLSRLWRDDSRATGRIYLGVVLGGSFGAPLGVTLAERGGWQLTFVALGVLAAVVAALVLWRQPGSRAPQTDARLESWRALGTKVYTRLLMSAAQFGAMFCVYANLAWVLELSGVSKGSLGGWLFAFGAAGLAGNAMASRWTGRSAHPASLLTASAFVAVSASIVFLPLGQVALFAAVCLWGSAHAASFVINQLQVTRAAPSAPRLAAAMNISAANIGIAAGSPLGAWALSSGGHVALGQTGMALAAFALGVALYCARPMLARRLGQIKLET